MTDLNSFIRDIPDFPKPGIIFKDITPLLKDSSAFNTAIDQMAKQIKQSPCDAIVGIESRGFIFGAPLALKLNVPFIPVRKPGKLPYDTISTSYDLEYGTDSVEIHKDALKKGQNVVIVDDLLATGGTMAACCELVKKLGAEISCCSFVIELAFLKGSEKLGDIKLNTLLSY